MNRITNIINSNKLLLRLAILNVTILTTLILYSIIIQFFELNNSSITNIVFDISLRILGGFVFAAISSLPYIIGWYFNTKLDKKMPLSIAGTLIFIIMNYQFWHPLFTQTTLSFGIGFILLPILLNIIILAVAIIIYVSEYVKKNIESSVLG